MGMVTQRLRAEGIGGEASVARAAKIVRAGGLVAFPTETVYGLGGNALDEAAVEKIFAAKERPGWDPLIVHVDGRAMLERVAVLPAGRRGTQAEALMKAFWPGPLTLLLPRTDAVPDAVTAGRSLAGVRVPAHPVARELIRLADVPIAAPSANRFGHTSPTTAAHVLADLDGRIDAVLDGGATRVGVESTVVGPDAEDDGRWMVYRPGGISVEALEAVLGAGALAVYRGRDDEAPESAPSPGVGIRHYAPRARLVLVRELLRAGGRVEDGLVEAVHEAARAGARVGAMVPDGWSGGGAELAFRWGPWGNAEVLARLLFFGMRLLDQQGAEVIVCPVPEMDGLGEAIRDRLEKAAKG